MMTIAPPTFPDNASVSTLYADALKVQTVAQAVAYMRGLVDHHYRLYGLQYATSKNAIKNIQWRNMECYAERTGYPMRGMKDLRRIYQMSREYGKERTT